MRKILPTLFKFEPVGKDALNVHVTIEHEDGSVQVAVFKYAKVK